MVLPCHFFSNFDGTCTQHLPSKCLYPVAALRCVFSLCSPLIRIAFTVCNEICNINHYYLSCDLDVDIEIEEQIYHRLI